MIRASCILILALGLTGCDRASPRHGEMIVPGVMFASAGYGRNNKRVYSLHYEDSGERIVPPLGDGDETITEMTIIVEDGIIHGTMYCSSDVRRMFRYFVVSSRNGGLGAHTFDCAKERDEFLAELCIHAASGCAGGRRYVLP